MPSQKVFLEFLDKKQQTKKIKYDEKLTGL